MEQTWNDLLFAHWPINPNLMRPLIPSALELHTFNQQCWIAITPFHMSGIRARWMPLLPGLSAFPELNVRTYVTYGGKPGVYFFSLDAGSRIAAWVARKTYHLPYFHARMSSVPQDRWIHYHSIRDSGAELKAKFRPTTPVQLRNTGTIEHWLTERYCLYTTHRNRVYRAEIHQNPGHYRMRNVNFPQILWPFPPVSSCPEPSRCCTSLNGWRC